MPKWLLEHMQVRKQEKFKSKETNRDGETVSERSIGAHQSRFNQVCRECNSGWLSSLESKVRPLLLSLIHDDKGTITVPEAETISRWKYKTSALFQMTGPADRELLISPNDLHHFYRHSVPAGESTVHMTFQLADKKAGKIRVFLPRSRYGTPQPTNDYTAFMRCFTSYLQIDQLILGFTYRNPNGHWSIGRENDMPERRQIWPTVVPVTWEKNKCTAARDPEQYFVEYYWARA